MVPENYHDFFVAAASVAGALIGLLFVAVSVSTGISGPDAELRLQIRAGAAFSALIDPLVISLAALIPDTELIVAPIALSVVGTVSCIAMFVVLRRDQPRIVYRDLALQAALVITYLLQLAGALRLVGNPNDVNAIKNQAVLLIVFFLIGISRAWELVGARDRGLIASASVLRGEHQHRSGHDAD